MGGVGTPRGGCGPGTNIGKNWGCVGTAPPALISFNCS